MNKIFKTLRHIAYIALGAVALVACGEDSPTQEPTPEPKTPEVVDPTNGNSTNNPANPTGNDSNSIIKISADAPAPGSEVTIPVVATDKAVDNFPGINKTNVSKIILRMYEGRFKNGKFAYAEGPKTFNSKHFSYEQEMTLEYRDNKWVVTSGEKCFVFIRGNAYITSRGGLYVKPEVPKGGKLPAAANEALPETVYGLWVEYYDAQGKLLNSGIAATGAFQTFFRTQDLKTLSTGEPLTPLTGEFMGYIYRDTNPFDKTVRSGQAKYIDETDPVGLKGFFFFNDRDARFAFNLELWQTPQGKLTDGVRAPFNEPSAHIKKTGRPVLSISIPAYVHVTRAQMDNYEEETKLEDEYEADQQMFKNLIRILGIDWTKMVSDINRHVEEAPEIDEDAKGF